MLHGDEKFLIPACCLATVRSKDIAHASQKVGWVCIESHLRDHKVMSRT